MNYDIKMRINVEKPVAYVAYGLQKGSGQHYETIQKQQSNGKDLYFDFHIKILRKKLTQPGFGGVFVQGSVPEKFIYLDIGKYAGQINSEWGRRLKIPLRGIGNEIISEIMQQPDLVLVTKVAGTGKDGGPNCATVKPFNGWHPQIVKDWTP